MARFKGSSSYSIALKSFTNYPDLVVPPSLPLGLSPRIAVMIDVLPLCEGWLPEWTPIAPHRGSPPDGRTDERTPTWAFLITKQIGSVGREKPRPPKTPTSYLLWMWQGNILISRLHIPCSMEFKYDLSYKYGRYRMKGKLLLVQIKHSFLVLSIG